MGAERARFDAMTCDCGAPGRCEDFYHAILAEEQGDPDMFAWHTPVVCAYLLQHPARGAEKYLDGQFRMLQLYVAEGLDALHRLSARQVAANRGGGTPPPIEGYEPLPQHAPGPFRASFSGLPIRDDSFVADGYEAYGRHIQEIAVATVDAYLGRL